jgi:ABC-type antimicrobial peptide transport system permease subunit
VLEAGLPAACAGGLAGLAMSLALGRGMAALLFEVRPTDPAVMAASALTVVAATLVACAAPARRASRSHLAPE